MPITTPLSKEELYKRFPYLEEELEYRTQAKVEGERTVGTTEYSKLEKAVLIRVDKRQGFPNPIIETDVSDHVTSTKETRVDLVNRRGKLIKTLNRAWKRTISTTQEVIPELGPGQDLESGEKTDEVVNKMRIKPKYVIIKEIKTTEKFRPVNKEVHVYDIEVYQIK